MDLRFVARSYWRDPVYVLTGVVLLAGAVAVNAAVLSFVRGTLMAEATFPDPDRVVVAWGSNAMDGQIRDVVSGPTFLDLRDRATTVDHLSALTINSAVLMEDGRPVVLDVEEVSADFFEAVPVAPHLGRTFDDRERTSGGPASILVSYAFWQDRLGGDPGIVGRTLPLDGAPHTVVGVLPPGFQFIMPSPIWRPLHDDVLAADDRGRIHYHLVGRLRAGAGPGDATRELSAVMADVAVGYPGFQGWSILVERIRDAAVVGVRSTIWSLAGAMVLVLLVALANLVTLFRIRTVGRADELRVRRALGGSGARLARVLALEAMGITLTGAALGLAVAPWVLAAVRDRVPVWIAIPDSAARIPALQASLDPWVVGGVMATALLCGALLAIPAVLGGVRAGGSLRPQSARGATDATGTRWLVVAELALATVLCMGAGLSVRSAHHLLATDVGLDAADLLGMWVGDVWDRPDEEQAAYFRQVVAAVEALPEVHSAATIDYLPFLQEDDYARVYFLDRDGQSVRDQREEWRRVGEGLFETAGMRMVEGRSFRSDELVGRPRSAVINEAFARKHYPDGDAVGSLLSTHDDRYEGLEIVGVVADVRAHGPAAPAPPMLYVPEQGRPRGTVGLYVRTRPGQAAASAEAVRDAIWSVDPSEPVTGIVPMAELVDAWVALPRTVRSLVSAVAGLALFLTGVGVFGVVGYAVRRRTAELGVRVALGASPRRLRREILARVAPLVVGGVAVGLAVGVVAAHAAASMFQGVAPWDPVALAGALVVMSGVAMAAAWLPARAAAGVDPGHAIRGVG
ncbi:MAG: ABC transporter permease [Longimicrobiales bacterium]